MQMNKSLNVQYLFCYSFDYRIIPLLWQIYTVRTV